MTFNQLTTRGAGSLQHAFRAFRYRNYRLFFFGQGVSVIGTWMQGTALAWMVYDLTKSKTLLGVVAFAGQVPSTFLTPFAGALSDRMQRRPILILSQTVAMLQAFILTALVFAHVLQTWHIVALSVLAGLTLAFDMPARQSFIVELVDDRRDLPNAIALNSVMFNSARFIGPALAGVMVHYWGVVPVFFANGVSYIAVIVAYFMMRTAPRRLPDGPLRIVRETADGFRYVFGHRLMRATLLLLAFFSLVGLPYMALVPVFAKDILKGDATTNGWLLSSVGVGAIGGAVLLATRKDASGLSGKILFAAALMSAGLMAFAFSTALWFSLCVLAVVGFSVMVLIAGSNTLMQSVVHDDKRGRLMGLFGWSFIGMAPFGSLLVGKIAQHVGAPWTVFGCGALCLVVVALFARTLLAAHASHVPAE